MASKKTNIVVDDQSIDRSANVTSVQTFASPVPPSMGNPLDNAGDIQTPIVPGGVTDDRQPEFNGQGTPGSIIVIKDNGTVIGLADVEANGTWTFTPSTDLLEGLHAITLVARNAAGEESQASAPFHFEIDVTPPDASKLFITGVMDDVGSVTGNVMSGATTDDTRPLLSGASSGVPGHTVTVMVKDATGMRELGQAVVGENGNWTFQVDTPLAAGQNTFSLVARDTAGNETMPTGRYKITVDTDTPSAPVIESVEDDVGTVQMLQKGDVTDDARPTFIGSAQAGDTVKLYDGSTLLGQVVADANGKWEFTPTVALVDGAHDVTATATSPLGQTSDASGVWNFTVDTVPPAAPTLVTVYDDVGATGNVANGGATDDAQPDFKGKAEANSTVVIKDGGVEIGRVQANAAGDWTFTPTTALSDGAHSITVTATDKAGNTSAPSAAFGFTVDATPLGAPTIETVVDNVGSITGNLANGGFTDDTRLDFKGKAEANSIVKVYDGSKLLGAVVADAEGNWAFTPSTALGEGAHSITVTATNALGSTSAPSAAFGFTVDTVAPTQTATLSAMGKDSGFSGADYLTNDGSAGRLMQGNLSAQLGAGETLQVSTDGGKTWTAAFVSGSQWSAQDDSSHAGNWAVQTRVVDEAGNMGAATSQAIVLDTVAPKAPTSFAATSGSIDISFDKTNAKAGDRLVVKVGDAYIERVLTAQEVTAGVATVKSALIAPASLLGDFEVVTLPAQNVVRMSGMTVTVSGGTAIVSSDYIGQYGVVGKALWIGLLDAYYSDRGARVDLDAAASSVQFTFGAVNPGMSAIVKYYSTTGELLFTDTKVMPAAQTIVPLTFQYTSTSKPIGSFVVTAPGDAAGVSLDNIKVESFISAGISAAIADPAGNVSQFIDLTGGLSNPQQTQQVTDAGIVYLGGAGNETFVVANVSTLSGAGAGIFGNGGLDTLKLTGAGQTLDLTALAGKVQGIEIIDITGTGNNTLKLSLTEVMNNGATNQFVSDGRVQMMVKGNAGDKVTLTDLLPNGVDAGDWVKKANVTVSGVVYEVYQHSGFGAELLVQQGVAVTLQNTAATFSSTALEVDADALAHSGYGTDVLAHATQAFTENDDTLIARLGFADRLAGGAGNDTITNVGTADVAHGGAGDDVIRINSGDFERVDGGLGIDTLVMDGKAMHIDLSALGMKVQGFEKFDLGAGGNTLALHASDVLAGGLRDMVTADGKVQMLVNGANGDVNLLGGNDDWTQGDSTSVGGVTYSVYTNLAGTAELLVEDKVHVTLL